MIKGSKQEDITIINIYVPNRGVTQYRGQMLTDVKEEVDINKIIVGEFNIPLIPDHPDRTLIRKHKP